MFRSLVSWAMMVYLFRNQFKYFTHLSPPFFLHCITSMAFRSDFLRSVFWPHLPGRCVGVLSRVPSADPLQFARGVLLPDKTPRRSGQNPFVWLISVWAELSIKESGAAKKTSLKAQITTTLEKHSKIKCCSRCDLHPVYVMPCFRVLPFKSRLGADVVRHFIACCNSHVFKPDVRSCFK